MAAARRPADVDEYIARHPESADALTRLRRAVRQGSKELEETIKWGAPVFVLDGQHVVGLGAFKSYVGLWFFQGALLEDPDGVLVQAQGKTRGLRQWRFASAKEIPSTRVAEYVAEAVANERAGKRIERKAAPSGAVELPDELREALETHAEAARAFEGLTPGRQREYAEYVASAKRADTRLRRVEKILPRIESGAGLNDHYRNC